MHLRMNVVNSTSGRINIEYFTLPPPLNKGKR
jgi:hypothetical protein